MFKLIKIILGLALVAAAAYFLFIRDGNLLSNTSGVKINLSENAIMDLASTTGQGVKSQAQSVFYDVSSAVKLKVDDIVGSATQQAKNYLFDMFKSAVENQVNSIGEKVGVSSSSLSTTTLP